MFKKTFAVVCMLLFGMASYALSQNDYTSELEAAKKELAELEEKITVYKERIKALTKEFNEADISLRQDLILCKSHMDEKTFIRESKRRQSQLKQDFHVKYAPVRQEYNGFKESHKKCSRSIKALNKRIDRLAGDPGYEAYNEEINVCRADVQAAKDKLHAGIAAIYEDANSQIEQITDMANKSKLKNQILSDAQVKEHALRMEYQKEKQAIEARIEQIRSSYKKSRAEFRMNQPQEAPYAPEEGCVEAKKAERANKKPCAKKQPCSNFSPANN
ncbi:MAG: hypothetical protein PHV77_01915 [Candidatus Omnitrophica bacterium]|jgi:predicted  nucleic acid-binding Zn-ribbon protein|nr:hypothetical protein [Candidatus Omnitrophota bacterium]